jgi:hypothetical protein
LIYFIHNYFWRCFYMSLSDITNQMYQARQASWDRMFYNLAQEEVENEEELADDEAAPTATAADPVATQTADPKAPAVPTATGTAQAPATPKDPAAPADPTAAPTDPTAAPADPTAPKDPLAPTDVAPGGNVEGQDGLVEDPELFKQLVQCLEEGHKGQGNSDMSFPNLKRALEKKGLTVNITGGEMLNTGKENTEDLQINATLEVTGNDGKRVVFKDTNGDGGIGVTDEGFAKAVQQYVPEKAAHLQQGKSDQRQNVALRAQGVKPPNAKKEALAKNFGGGGGEAAAAPAAEAPAAEAQAVEAATAAAPAAGAAGDKAASDAAEAAVASVAAPAEAAAEPSLAAVNDKLAIVSSVIASGDDQVNEKGDTYKYQVKDTDLNKCPKGKKKCNGCGQCIKTELYEAQKNQDTVEINQNGEEEQVEAAETVAAEQQAAQKPDVPKPPVNDAQVKPELAAADEQEVAEVLKQIQAHLDSFGFADKTAEELLADGQLEQIALQLGIYVPENIFK